MNNNCDVIRDLLPLYVENMLSEKSCELVEEHLEKCENCRKALAEMKKTEFEISHNVDPIKRFSKTFRKHTITVAGLSVLITVGVIILILSLVFLEYFPLLPSIFVLLLLVGIAAIIGKRTGCGIYKNQSKTTSQEDSLMKKKMWLFIFICSVLALLISLKLFWNIAVYADDFASYPYASPQAIYGGNFWLYMSWLRLALLSTVAVLSGIKLFKK